MNWTDAQNYCCIQELDKLLLHASNLEKALQNTFEKLEPVDMGPSKSKIICISVRLINDRWPLNISSWSLDAISIEGFHHVVEAT